MVNPVEIRSTEDGPNLIVVDGNVFAASADVVFRQISRSAMEHTEKLTSALKKRSPKWCDKPFHTAY